MEDKIFQEHSCFGPTRPYGLKPVPGTEAAERDRINLARFILSAITLLGALVFAGLGVHQMYF